MNNAIEAFREAIEKARMLHELKQQKKRLKELKGLLEDMCALDFYCPEYTNKEGPSWRVDRWSYDTTGHTGDLKVDSGYDEIWEIYSNQGSFFDRVFEDVFSFVGDKKSRQWNWNEGMDECGECTYELWHAGYQGERLVLVEFDGYMPVKDEFDSAYEYVVNALKISYEDLEAVEKYYDIFVNEMYYEVSSGTSETYDIKYMKKLVAFCKSLSKFAAKRALNDECNYRRYEIENEWKNGNFGDFDGDVLLEFLENDAIPARIKKKVKTYFDEEGGTAMK